MVITALALIGCNKAEDADPRAITASFKVGDPQLKTEMIGGETQDADLLYPAVEKGRGVFIDSKGTVRLRTQGQWTEPFVQGLAAVSFVDGTRGGTGFIDRAGKWVIPPIKGRATSFSDGLARFNNNQGSRGFLDRNGKVAFWTLPAGVSPYFKEGFTQVRASRGQIGFMDKTGNITIAIQFDRATDFSEGVACVSQHGKFGVIDKTGAWVVRPQFNGLAAFSEGLTPVILDGKAGYIDKTGKWVIETRFTSTHPFSEGLAAVTVNTAPAGDPPSLKMGYIDRTGKPVIAPQFAAAEPFSSGMAIFTDGTMSPPGPAGTVPQPMYGYIDRTGHIVIKPQAWVAQPFVGDLARVHHLPAGQMVGSYIDKQGKIIWTDSN